MAFVNYLDHGARRAPDAACLQMAGAQLTYREVQQLSHRIGNKLASLGLGRGDHASILATNDMLAFICVFGFSRAQRLKSFHNNTRKEVSIFTCIQTQPTKLKVLNDVCICMNLTSFYSRIVSKHCLEVNFKHWIR